MFHSIHGLDEFNKSAFSPNVCMGFHSSVGRPWVRIPLKSRNFFRVNLQLPLRRPYLHLNLYFLSSHHPDSMINMTECTDA